MCEVATQFYQTYYLQLVQEIFAVMTDSFHKPGFKQHAAILYELFNVLDSNAIKAPLWDVAAKGPSAYPSNNAFVREHVAGLLTTSFPNLTQPQVRTRFCFLLGCGCRTMHGGCAGRLCVGLLD